MAVKDRKVKLVRDFVFESDPAQLPNRIAALRRENMIDSNGNFNTNFLFKDVFSEGARDYLGDAGVFNKPYVYSFNNRTANRERRYGWDLNDAQNDLDDQLTAYGASRNLFNKVKESGLQEEIKRVLSSGDTKTKRRWDITDRTTYDPDTNSYSTGYGESGSYIIDYAKAYDTYTASAGSSEFDPNSDFSSLDRGGEQSGGTLFPERQPGPTGRIPTDSPEFNTLYGLGLVDQEGNYIGGGQDFTVDGPTQTVDDLLQRPTVTTEKVTTENTNRNRGVQRLPLTNYETPAGGLNYQDPRFERLLSKLVESGLSLEESIGIITAAGGTPGGASLADTRNYDSFVRDDAYNKQFNLAQLNQEGQLNLQDRVNEGNIAVADINRFAQHYVAETQAGRYDREGKINQDTGQFEPSGNLQESDVARLHQQLLAQLNADTSLQTAQLGVNNPYGYSGVLANVEDPSNQLDVLSKILALQSTDGFTQNPEQAFKVLNDRAALEASGGLLGYNDQGATSGTLRDSILDQIRAQASGGLTDPREIARQQELRSVNDPYSFVQAQINPYTAPQPAAQPQGQTGVTPTQPTTLFDDPTEYGHTADRYRESLNVAANRNDGNDPSSDLIGGPPGANLQAQTLETPPLGPGGQTPTPPTTPSPEDANLQRALAVLRQTQLAAAAPDIQQQNVNLLSDPSALGAVAAIGGAGAVNQIFQRAGFAPLPQQGGETQLTGFGGVQPGTGDLAANTDDELGSFAFNNPNIFTNGQSFFARDPLQTHTLNSFGSLSDVVQQIGIGASATTGQTPNDVYSRLRRNSPSGREGSQVSRFASV